MRVTYVGNFVFVRKYVVVMYVTFYISIDRHEIENVNESERKSNV